VPAGHVATFSPADCGLAATVGAVVLKPFPSKFHCWTVAGVGTTCAAFSAAHSFASTVKKCEFGPGVTDP
jgi:hypothetical protein